MTDSQWCPEFVKDWDDPTSLICVGCQQHVDAHIEQWEKLRTYYHRQWRDCRDVIVRLAVIKGEKTS